MRKKNPHREKTAFPRTASAMVELNIANARNKYIRNMIEPWDKSTDWIMEKLFPEYVLGYLKLGYEHTTDGVRGLNSCSLGILSNVFLRTNAIYFHEKKMLPPREEYKIDPNIAIPELVTHCVLVREILYDYAKVSRVFNWFNSCGSNAYAMRNYCPWIQTVLPGEYHACIEGTRFREPDGLAPMLGLIKEVSCIMGRANLIQNDTLNKNKQGVCFHFNHITVNNILVPDYVMEC